MGSELAVTKQEREIGIVVGSLMKMSTQCAVAVRKANSMLGIIRKGIENKTASIILPLYKSMVQPHLGYSVQFWTPHLKKDIIELEKVQKRATKMIKGMEHHRYEGRLQQLGLFSLEKKKAKGRRDRGVQNNAGCGERGSGDFFLPLL